MPEFFLHITDGVEKEMALDFRDEQDAVNSAFNALSLFVSRKFPPPETVTIEVRDGGRALVATLRMAFSVDYARARAEVH